LTTNRLGTLPILNIELVPTTCWYSNLRSELSPGQWDVVRRRTYLEAGYKCEICGGKGKKWPVEAHEVWEYNDCTYVQKLVRTIALCPACHGVKHIGFAAANGRYNKALRHLMKVNKWSAPIAVTYIDHAFEEHGRRSAHNWTLDISWLEKTFKIIPSGDRTSSRSKGTRQNSKAT
jgi:hypothetical protein